MNSDPEHSRDTFLHRFRAHTFRLSSVQSIRAVNPVRYEGEPRSLDGCDEGVLAASISRRRQYDAVLPALNLPNRSRLRLTLDLIVGIPFLLMLWRLDEVRVRLERITSRINRTAAANRHEKCRKKYEASQQRKGEAGQKEPAHARGAGVARQGQRAKGGSRRQG